MGFEPHPGIANGNATLPLLLFAQRGEQVSGRHLRPAAADTWMGPLGCWCGQRNSWCWCGVSSQWFAATHSVTPFGLTSRAAITGVVYSISPRPEALRNGYDSLSHPAVTALPAVRGSLRSCVLRTCFAGRYRMGLINQTSFGKLWGCLDAAVSGSPYSVPRHPEGSAHGRLSHGPY